MLLFSVPRLTFSPASKSLNFDSCSSLICRRFSIRAPFRSCATSQERRDSPVDMTKYREVFAKRMAMAGLKPHHAIAMGVSGGPDSIALCVLAAGWKTDGLSAAATESNGFIKGLLAVVVDHALRAESKDEADLVCRRVTDMGIRCQIARCEWSDGRPKQSHLQEAARDKRYEILQQVCIHHQIGVLLIAHHADDQAELFILRLSRNSGVLGLAGMAFTSQLFPKIPAYSGEDLSNCGILLVRPLLEFSKDDMYKICQGENQEWVEDPTNRSPLFARNRIRMLLNDFSTSTVKAELQAVISECRRTRLYVDQICSSLIYQALAIMPHGYAIVDLEVLKPSEVKDICLSKFIALVAQFVSQRHRPVRGGASKLLLSYVRAFPCKTSFTAAGCYFCPAPGSKGTKLLVCCAVDYSSPSKMAMLEDHSNCKKSSVSSEMEQIFLNSNLCEGKFISDAHLPFIDSISPGSVLLEAKRNGILGESTYMSILSMREHESEKFKCKPETVVEHDLRNGIECPDSTMGRTLCPGQIGYFMNRILVKWNMNKETCYNSSAIDGPGLEHHVLQESLQYSCTSCLVGNCFVAEVRCMTDADWLYLVKLVKCPSTGDSPDSPPEAPKSRDISTRKINTCSDYAILSAQRAFLSLKSIPVAARRGLPVLVNPEGLLLSIPSVGFEHCPSLKASAIFKPRIPLGGGHSSFI